MEYIDSLSQDLHHKKGYAIFNLKDFDETLYTQLKEYHTDEYYKKIRGFHSHVRNDFDTDVPPSVLKQVLKKFEMIPTEGWSQWEEDTKKNYSSKRFSYAFSTQFDDENGHRISILSERQIKLQNDYIQYIKSISKRILQIWTYDSTHGEDDLVEIHDKILKKICNTFYSDYKYSPSDLGGMDRTCYPKGAFLNEHQDDNNGLNLCAILIYLNKDYDRSWGGYLELHNYDYRDITEPHFGNVAILDFQRHSAFHEVKEVLKNQRYALLQFMHKVEK